MDLLLCAICKIWPHKIKKKNWSKCNVSIPILQGEPFSYRPFCIWGKNMEKFRACKFAKDLICIWCVFFAGTIEKSYRAEGTLHGNCEIIHNFSYHTARRKNAAWGDRHNEVKNVNVNWRYHAARAHTHTEQIKLRDDEQTKSWFIFKIKFQRSRKRKSKLSYHLSYIRFDGFSLDARKCVYGIPQNKSKYIAPIMRYVMPHARNFQRVEYSVKQNISSENINSE